MTEGNTDSLFTDIFRLIPASLILFTIPDGRIIELSDDFLAMIGFGRPVLTGKNLLQSGLFFEPKLIQEAIDRFNGKGVNAPFLIHIMRNDRTAVIVEMELRRFDKNGISYNLARFERPGHGNLNSSTETEDSFYKTAFISADDDFASIVDTAALQELMNYFYRITGAGIGIIDINGKIHVGTGWQDICTQFHRANPATEKNCMESDAYLGSQAEKGEYCQYKCKNLLWDMASPIIIGGRHMANLFLGQFLYENETPDISAFEAQADRYGFDRSSYLDALNRVPRWSREFVNNLMSFYTRLATLVGEMGLAKKNMEDINNILRISEDKYRSIFENGMEGIFQTSFSGKMLNANPAMARILGYDSPSELITDITNIMEQLYVNPEDRNTLLSVLSEKDIISGFEVQMYRRDREVRWVSITARNVRNHKNRPIYIEGFMTDITERKILEEQLIQSQKMEGLGLLAGGIAHDFNNILTPILGYTEMMILNTSGSSEKKQAYLHEIQQAALSARELTNRLLAFSRKQIIELKTVDPGDIIKKFENILRRTIREDIGIRINITPGIHKINADTAQIEQILINLSINAQDAMPRGGTITIEASNLEIEKATSPDYAEIPEGSYVLIRVSDTGTGIDTRTMGHIFDPFFTTKEKGKGTGLGLSTVYGIVKQHNGYIHVSSEKKKGSSFMIFIPVSRNSRTGPMQVKDNFDTETPLKGSETILVTEDNEKVRDLASMMLENLGYTVLIAESPEIAINFANRYNDTIHLLLTDVVMPDMDGNTLFHRLHSMRPDMKVLYMSGYAQDVMGSRGIAEESIHLLQKPFTLRALSIKMREALET